MANYYNSAITTTDRFEDFLDLVEQYPTLWKEFSILSDEDDEAVEMWIDTWDWSGANLEIAKRDLIGIGQADDNGSLLAFWNDGSGNAIDELPIVILGSEGELPIIAQNLKDLLLLMSTGEELFIDCHYATSHFGKCHPALAAWLKQEFDAEPLASSKEADAIINEAKSIHGEVFETWAREAIDPDFFLA